MTDYSKFFTGTPLFMKSDSDGTKDAQWNKMPLGIKSPSEGIQHFTNWQSISKTLERDNLARLEHAQVNRVNFSQRVKPNLTNRFVGSAKYGSGKNEYLGEHGVGSAYIRIEDSWRPNKIKILDDMAFVAQEEYTDIVRDEYRLETSWNQYAIRCTRDFDSNSNRVAAGILGTIVSDPLPLPGPLPFSASVDSLGNYRRGEFYDNKHIGTRGGSLSLLEYDNVLLKMVVGRGNAQRIWYLRYGGTVKNNFHNVMHKGTEVGLNFSDMPYRFQTNPIPSIPAIDRFGLYTEEPYAPKGAGTDLDVCLKGGELVGYYFLVPMQQSPEGKDGTDNPDDWASPDLRWYLGDLSAKQQEQRDLLGDDWVDPRDDFLNIGGARFISGSNQRNPILPTQDYVNLGKQTAGSDARYVYGGGTGGWGIQLCFCQSLPPDIVERLEDHATDRNVDISPLVPYTSFMQKPNGEIFSDTVGEPPVPGPRNYIQMFRALHPDIVSATLIQFTPVRKCGKVDIYTRKRGFITSVTDGGALISEDHNLNTGDIIEIKNVLLAENSTRFDSRHPLNGIKYVSVENDNTFRVYDDQFLTKPTFVKDIRSFDGVTFKSISNTGLEEDQAWSFVGSLFSPTGRNGYGGYFTDSIIIHAPLTTRTLPQVDCKTGIHYGNNQKGGTSPLAWQTHSDGALHIEFNDYEYSYQRVENKMFSHWAEGIDESFPMSSNSFDPKEHMGASPNYPRSWYTSRFGNLSKSYLDYFHGSHFGSDIDVTFSHKEGNNSVYFLSVGERGSEFSVDLFGLNDGYVEPLSLAESSPFSSLPEPVLACFGKAKMLPSALPYGKNHIYKISVDQYNNLSGLAYTNTLFGGGVSLSDFNSFNADGETPFKNISRLRELNPWRTKIENTYRSSWFAEGADYAGIIDTQGVSGGGVIQEERYPNGGVGIQPYEIDNSTIYHSNYWGRSAVVSWAPISFSEWRVNSLGERATNVADWTADDFTTMGYYDYWDWHFYARQSIAQWKREYNVISGNLVAPAFMRNLLGFSGPNPGITGNLFRSFGTVIPGVQPYSIFGGEDISDVPVVDGPNFGPRIPPGVDGPGDIPGAPLAFDSIFAMFYHGLADQYFADPNPLNRTDNYFTFTPYEIISRDYDGPENNWGNKRLTASKNYIFPYVDSFGKSVAIKASRDVRDMPGSSYGSNDPKLIVVTGSNTRGNIPFVKDAEKKRRASLNFDQEELTTEERESQIGQLQANFLYQSGSSTANADFMYINSGGSDCGRFFENMTLKSSKKSPNDNGIYQRALAKGSHAGFGYREVATSCHLSATRIEWVGNQLVWADQELYSGRSTINILDFDDSGDKCFTPSSVIQKSFIDRRFKDKFGLPTAVNTGDGFGVDFRFDGTTLVTNSRSTHTPYGDSIESMARANWIRPENGWDNDLSTRLLATYLPFHTTGKIRQTQDFTGYDFLPFVLEDFNGLNSRGNPSHIFNNPNSLPYINWFLDDYPFDRIDLLDVYEKHESGFHKIQTISPTINSSDTEYYSWPVINRNFRLLELDGTINHSNKTLASKTWNMNFQDMYDIVDGRILFKDVLEYCLYEKEPGIDSKFANLSPSFSSYSCYPYLAVSENTKYGDRYFADTTLEYQYIPSRTLEYQCSSFGGEVSTHLESKTPVVFFDLGLDDLDFVEGITIEFEISDDSIFSQFDLIDASNAMVSSERTDNIIPRIVLYSQDPRTTIIKNGPLKNDSPADRKLITDNSTRPSYEQGIYTGAPSKYFDHLTYYGYNFPGAFRGGAQDLFLYQRTNYDYPHPYTTINSAQRLPDKDGILLAGDDGGLGPVYDKTAGSRLGGAGDPSFFSHGDYYAIHNVVGRDNWTFSNSFKFYWPRLGLPEGIFPTYSNYSLDPMATIYLPTATANGYTLTLTAEQLKGMIIDGSVVRDEDRPDQFFNSFKDSENIYWRDGGGGKTLAIGFVLTNLNEKNLVSDWEEPASFEMGPLRDMCDSRGNHRYPYQKHVNYFNPVDINDISDPYIWNGKSIQYQMSAVVKNVSVNVQKRRYKKLTYKNKFHKIAAISWHNLGKESARNKPLISSYTRIDLGGNSFCPDWTYQYITKYFGTDSLVPIPNVETSQKRQEPGKHFGKSLYPAGPRTTTHSLANWRFDNPIIAISRESSAFPFNDDREIFATEYTREAHAPYFNRTINYADRYNDGTLHTNLYLDKNTGNATYQSTFDSSSNYLISEFKQRNFVGSFDLNRSAPGDSMSLYINCNADRVKDIPLFTIANDVLNNNHDLFIDGVGKSNNDMTLFVGVRSDDKGADLFISPPFLDALSLFTYEKAPSGDITLFHRGPYQDGAMTLTFAKPPSGLIPLYSQGPLTDSNDMRLYMVSTHEEDTTLVTGGFGKLNKRMNLFIDSFGVHEQDIPLTFSAGHSGVMPLFMSNNNKPTADLDLVMPSTIDEANQEMPLFISRNSHEESTSLFVKSQIYYNSEDYDLSPTLFVNGPKTFSDDGTDLYISGPVTGTKNDVDLYIRSIFPSGQISLFTDPIGVSDTLMPLHMASIQETIPMYLYNLDGSIAPLNIVGESIASDRKVSLFMNNTDTVNDISLFTSAPKTKTISLLVGGSLEPSSVGFASLWTGKDIDADNKLSLFVQNSKSDAVSSEGVAFNASDTSLIVAGGNEASDVESTTLFLLGQPFNSGNLSADLFVKVNEPIIGDGGGISESGKLPTFIEGNNDANVYNKYNDSSSLYIVNTSLDSGSADLYIHRPNEFSTTLHIQSLHSSGVADLYMSGAYIASSGVDLYITPPEAVELDMFTRGYLE